MILNGTLTAIGEGLVKTILESMFLEVNALIHATWLVYVFVSYVWVPVTLPVDREKLSVGFPTKCILHEPFDIIVVPVIFRFCSSNANPIDRNNNKTNDKASNF